MSKLFKIKPPKVEKDIEETFLAVCLLTGSHIPVPEDAFRDGQCLDVYRAIKMVAEDGEEINLVTVLGACKKINSLVTADYLGYLFTSVIPFLEDRVPESFKKHAVNALLEYHQRFLLTESLIKELGEQRDIATALVDLEDKIKQIQSLTARRKAQKVSVVVDDLVADLAEQKNRGVKIGLPKLDARLYGWQPGDLIIVCARPSVGKTSFMLSSIYHTLFHVKHLVFSLEMTTKQLLVRLIAADTGVPYLDILKSETNTIPEIKVKIDHAISKIKQSNLFIIDDNSLKLLEFEQIIKDVQPDVVWVDYLGLLHNAVPGMSFRQREREVAYYSSFFKLLAKRYDIPVIVLSQLNRNAVKENRPPQLHDLRESGAIEQDADIVIGLHNKDDFNKEVLLLKGRNIGLGTMDVAWNGTKMLFYERYDFLNQ